MKRVFILTLLIVVAVTAIVFRFYSIESLPGGLFPDEAANGLDANLILEGEHASFFERGNGRESLFFYLEAVSIKFFGIGVWQLHIVSALIGALTAVAVFLLGWELWNWRVGFLAGAMLAVSHWHVTMSRTGFRAILLALVATLALYFAVRFFRSLTSADRIVQGALAGLFFGLTFYTYIASRVLAGVVLVLVVLLIIVEIRKKKFPLLRQVWKAGLVGVAVLLLTIAPLWYYFYSHPGTFIGRAGQVSVFNPDLNQGDALGTLQEVTKLTFQGFITKGDLNWRHNVSGYPLLDPVVASFFYIGLAITTIMAIWIFIKILRGKSSYVELRTPLLWGWFVAMLLPEITTAEGIPHGLRLAGAVPPIFLLAAIGADTTWQRVKRLFGSLTYPRARALNIGGSAVLILLVIFSATFGWYLYFVVAGNSPEQAYAYRSDLTTVSSYINERNSKEDTYLVLDKFSEQTPLFLTSANNTPYVLVDPATSYQQAISGDEVIVFTQSTIFDASKYEETFVGKIEITTQEYNKHGQEILRVYSRK